MQIAGCQPDSGKPTVRDERGAYGNVSYGRMRNPLHTLKRCMSETLCLRVRAPYFYPTSGAGVQRGNAGTWESHLSPCCIPGVGDRVTTGPGVILGASTGTRARKGDHKRKEAGKVSGRRATSEAPETGRWQS